jgi:osmotically-inducible protein OsmY
MGARLAEGGKLMILALWGAAPRATELARRRYDMISACAWHINQGGNMALQWNTMRRILGAVLLGALLGGGIAGCESTATRRSVGETFDDATLTANVKSKLASAMGAGSIVGINVDSYRGAVTLSGFVNSAEDVTKAGEAARKTSGVKDVKNALQVKPKS